MPITLESLSRGAAPTQVADLGAFWLAAWNNDSRARIALVTLAVYVNLSTNTIQIQRQYYQIGDRRQRGTPPQRFRGFASPLFGF